MFSKLSHTFHGVLVLLVALLAMPLFSAPAAADTRGELEHAMQYLQTREHDVLLKRDQLLDREGAFAHPVWIGSYAGQFWDGRVVDGEQLLQQIESVFWVGKVAGFNAEFYDAFDPGMKALILSLHLDRYAQFDRDAVRADLNRASDANRAAMLSSVEDELALIRFWFDETKAQRDALVAGAGQPTVQPGPPQVGDSCGAVWTQAERVAAAQEVIDAYENGSWKTKRKENGVQTYDVAAQLRDRILNANYFNIFYEINKPIWKAKLACADACIMATPKNVMLKASEWASYRACLADCRKSLYNICDRSGTVVKPGSAVQ